MKIIIVIFLGLLCLGVGFIAFGAFKPALDIGVASGGNATWLPYYQFQDAILANMWIVIIVFILICAISAWVLFKEN